MITDPGAIRDRLEQLTKEAEAHNAELTHQVKELQGRLAEKNVSTPETPSFTFGDNVNLRIGVGRAARVIRSNASYDQVVSAFQSVIGPRANLFASKVDGGRYIWLRTNFDIKFLFTSYFAENLPAVELEAIYTEVVQPIKKFNLNKELPYRDGMVAFKVECAGPEEPLIYLAFPDNMAIDTAQPHLRQVFGDLAALRFVDEAGDVVTIDSVESWDYALATARRLSKVGRYPLLLVQTVSAE
jgi:hypothetical protein